MSAVFCCFEVKVINLKENEKKKNFNFENFIYFKPLFLQKLKNLSQIKKMKKLNF